MAENENIELARKQIAALNARDLDQYLSRIGDSYVGQSEITPQVHGPAGVRESVGNLLNALPDLRVEIQDILASGDTVVTRFRVTGTHKGNLAGIPASGKSITFEACNVTEIEGGKVVRSRVYGDNLTLFQQIGAVSLPRAATA
jgi:steroid delta-isomerase-like uncharacterized protein